MALETLVAPATEPLTVSEARAFLRIGSDGDDTVLANLIAAAREAFEARTGRALVSRTIRQRFIGPRRAGFIMPGRSTVTSIVAVLEVASDGTETLAANNLIKLVDGKFLLTREVPGLSIDYVAGFGTAAAVPQAHKIALLEAISDVLLKRDGQEVEPSMRAWEQAFSEVKL